MESYLYIPSAGKGSVQASERKRMWETKNVNGEKVNVDDARKRTIQHLQFREVNYYLTQLLSGHG